MAEDQDLFADESLPDDVLDHLDAPEIRARWPQALSDLIAVVAAANARAGYSPDDSRRHAYRIVQALAQYAGGRQLYVPQGRNLERALRDHRLFMQYNGRNIAELVQRFELSENQVYIIIGEQRQLKRRRMQPELFDTQE